VSTEAGTFPPSPATGTGPWAATHGNPLRPREPQPADRSCSDLVLALPYRSHTRPTRVQERSSKPQKRSSNPWSGWVARGIEPWTRGLKAVSRPVEARFTRTQDHGGQPVVSVIVQACSSGLLQFVAAPPGANRLVPRASSW